MDILYCCTRIAPCDEVFVWMREQQSIIHLGLSLSTRTATDTNGIGDIAPVTLDQIVVLQDHLRQQTLKWKEHRRRSSDCLQQIMTKCRWSDWCIMSKVPRDFRSRCEYSRDEELNGVRAKMDTTNTVRPLFQACTAERSPSA
ncbi:hypothetical protein AVEN_150480-1 [Araneus ventricosus]|uniref:Uncharacterized protein n=1 Tax=Araneus ventricosus TaxID=182803 RepID=A0A4Y2VTY5_ARAVE|nr:hypothetical protein AVEN_150480-1 [Araneus ventricosus]